MTNAGRHSNSRSQETGANRPLQPLSRAKEERMRVSAGFFRALSVFLLLSFPIFSAAASADLKVKVVDPQGAAVSGAQVSLVCVGVENSFVRARRLTSAEGTAQLSGQADSKCHVEVLAAGFAAESIQVRKGADFTVSLRVAMASETVVVSATKSPLSAEESGASISTLENGELETMQPVAASDAMRFLPGAVVGAAGQRGGLATLFVRGGDSVYNKVIVDGVPIT